MESLRRARRLARLMLACFVLALGTAIVAPLFASHGGAAQFDQLQFASICSANGNFAPPADGGNPLDNHKHRSLDCPLCLFGDAAPSFDWPSLGQAHPLAHALRPIEAARLASLTGAPLPARGPPTRA
ncbi:MAG: DUF2946 family protein [Burkholderiales bacterium]|nr:DUF2946 family protein [Burkholderiales bacterium]